MVIMHGQYRPGQYKRTIKLDDQVENWTSTTTNPKLPERLTFRVKPYYSGANATAGDAVAYERNLSYRTN